MKIKRLIGSLFILSILCFTIAGILIVQSKDEFLKDDSKFKHAVQIDESIELNQNINKLDIQTLSGDVRFHESETNEIRVSLRGNLFHIGFKRQTYDLIIKETDTTIQIRDKYPAFNIGITLHHETYLDIYLPKTYQGALTLATLSSDIVFLEDTHVFNELTIKSTSGNIKVDGYKPLSNESGYPLTLKTTSGNIKLTNSEISALHVKSTSGNILLDHVTIDNMVSLKTTSGNIKGVHFNSKSLVVHTTSGTINLSGTHQEVNIQSTSGKTTLVLDQNLINMQVRTTSGNISVVLDKQYAFNYDLATTSGKINVNLSELKTTTSKSLTGAIGLTSNIIMLRSTSGDIKISTN